MIYSFYDGEVKYNFEFISDEIDMISVVKYEDYNDGTYRQHSWFIRIINKKIMWQRDAINNGYYLSSKAINYIEKASKLLAFE